MMFSLWMRVAVIFCAASNLQLGSTSYLGYPRINFAGKFRADTDTRNNDPCNYRLDKPLNNDFNADWGFNGTNEFQFFDSVVTSIVGENDEPSPDPIISGQAIVGNLHRPYAKIVDLDTDCQDKSTIYGMKFGISLDNSDDTFAFYGTWTPSVIAQNMWPRIKCYSKKNTGGELYQDSFPLGASATTFVTDIEWNEEAVTKSTVLEQLKQNSGGALSVRISLFYYTRNMPSYVPFNATLGYVVGTIGPKSDLDTLNIAGQRFMATSPDKNIPIGVKIPDGDLCVGQTLSDFFPWLSGAPFEVNKMLKKVSLDLSNSMPSNLKNTFYDIGELKVGILHDTCVELLGEESIPYLETGWLENIGGIYSVDLTDQQVLDLTRQQLVLVQVVQSSEGSNPVCELTKTIASDSAQILLEETPYFIRPKDYYVDRLEQKGESTKTLYVTHFGEVPEPGTKVTVCRANSDVIPLEGVIPYDPSREIDENGLVEFTFSISGTIPFPREYSNAPCMCVDREDKRKTLPLDGQVYKFDYFVGSIDCSAENIGPSLYQLTFLAFSTELTYTCSIDSSCSWVDHVRPIFTQYAQVTPIMMVILNMTNYEDVTKSHNIELLKRSLSLDFNHPSYMPTTRDLSNAKRKMILSWLDNPIYGDETVADTANTCKRPGHSSYTDFKPARCTSNRQFKKHPREETPYFAKLSHEDSKEKAKLEKLRGKREHFAKLSHADRKEKAKLEKLLGKRPLLGFMEAKRSNDMRQCTSEDLKRQLHTAMQLEFATIPVYLTAMYSIVEGCNQEIYDIISSTVMQEMMHMTQVANILIALGGSPEIDNEDFVPSYPTHLPGGVLPSLTVALRKLSIPHVFYTLMGIELPQETEVGGNINFTDIYTIGALYGEIEECIRYLDETETLFDEPNTALQVLWPWKATETVGDVILVEDSDSAIEAIDLIISQGEGADIVNPYDIDNNTLGHFFRFEQIVCQHKIQQIDDDTYAYIGEDIPFNPNGVWPMRDNPSVHCILPQTNCHTQSRVFHNTFRALLSKLEKVFNGSPKEIAETVDIMEALHVHAKKLMYTKFRPESNLDDTTCGPVWDYEWPDTSLSEGFDLLMPNEG